MGVLHNQDGLPGRNCGRLPLGILSCLEKGVVDLFLHHEQSAETRRGTLGSRAQEDPKKRLKVNKTGATALDISRLPVRDFGSKLRAGEHVSSEIQRSALWEPVSVAGLDTCP